MKRPLDKAQKLETEDAESCVEWHERAIDRNESRTVMRAIDVLKCFRASGEELRLSDAIERTGLPRTTTFRLLKTLVHAGLIELAGPGVYRNLYEPISVRGLPAAPAELAAGGDAGERGE
jgi:IclR helix-turn-helix domain